MGLRPAEHLPLLKRLALHGVAGGRARDLLAAETARQAGAEAFLTLNRREIAELAQPGFCLLLPGEAPPGPASGRPTPGGAT